MKREKSSNYNNDDDVSNEEDREERVQETYIQIETRAEHEE